MAYIPKRGNKRPWVAKRQMFEGRTQNPFYWSTIWRRKRASFVREHPLCLHCLKEGKHTPTQEIDHIKPINPANAYDTQNGRFGQPLDDNNLQPLCTSCHMKKTGKQKGKEYR